MSDMEKYEIKYNKISQAILLIEQNLNRVNSYLLNSDQEKLKEYINNVYQNLRNWFDNKITVPEQLKNIDDIESNDKIMSSIFNLLEYLRKQLINIEKNEKPNEKLKKLQDLIFEEPIKKDIKMESTNKYNHELKSISLEESEKEPVEIENLFEVNQEHQIEEEKKNEEISEKAEKLIQSIKELNKPIENDLDGKYEDVMSFVSSQNSSEEERNIENLETIKDSSYQLDNDSSNVLDDFVGDLSDYLNNFDDSKKQERNYVSKRTKSSKKRISMRKYEKLLKEKDNLQKELEEIKYEIAKDLTDNIKVPINLVIKECKLRLDFNDINKQVNDSSIDCNDVYKKATFNYIVPVNYNIKVHKNKTIVKAEFDRQTKRKHHY